MNPVSTKDNLHDSTRLLINLADGDLDAFKKIYSLHFKKVFHFSRRFAMSIEDAEEITQDVFIKLWQRRSQIDSEKSFDSFLFTIAQNLVIDRMRQYVAYTKRLKQVGIRQELNKAGQNNTEQLINYYELSEIIKKLIDNLPKGRRTVFKLNREKGFTYQEIADLMHVSRGTVEKQMGKALKTLTDELWLKYGIRVDL